MMRLPSFNYEAPQTLDEVLKLLSEDPENTRVVAGGTDLWPNMKRRHQSAERVVSLRNIAELQGIAWGEDGGCTIPAMTTLSAIVQDERLRADHPGLVRAVASISTPTLRNMGTLGGNLCLDTRCSYYNQSEEWRRAIGYCMKECGETCWVAPASSRCFATSASDSAPLLCAVDAEVELQSLRGTRRIKVAELFQDDGIDYLAKQRDELLTRIFLSPADRWRAGYWKLRRRGSIDFPVLGVGAALSLEGKTIKDARIFIGALTSAPISMEDASASLRGQAVSEEIIAEAALIAKKASAAFDNTDFDLKWRRQMVEPYVEGVLRELTGLEARMKSPRHGLNPLVFEV